jgi:FtsH-binding integral membrane protein
MMGLSPGKVLLAISIGSIIGCTIIAIGAEVIKNLFLMNPALGIAVTVIVVAVLLILYTFYRMRMRKKTR